MRYRLALLAILAFVSPCGGSTDSSIVAPPGNTGNPGTPGTPVATGFQTGTIVDGSLSNPYQVFVPLNYDANQKRPLIIFLHGSGERGTDNQLQVNVGLGPVVKAQQSTWPAITVFPQVGLNESQRAGYVRLAQLSYDLMVKNYNIDPTRVYLTGLSAGGVYAFEALYKYPTRFAAIVPIAANMCPVCITGSTSSTQADAANAVARAAPTIGYWAFQGDADPNTPVADARVIASTWQKVNASAKYTEYPGVGHNSWDAAYGTPALFTWLFAQHR